MYLKRWFDIIVAMVALILTIPVMSITAICIFLTMGRPVMFRQLRPGKHAQPFWILKFRTMVVAVGSDGEVLGDEQRLTKIGRVIRSFSLDELPQLWNVLRGDMSIVGPRPLLMQYLALYSPAQSRRHEVRPGVTGWAQVQGRNDIPWAKRLELDVWYVDNWSFWLDLRIIALTCRAVLIRTGVTREGHATVPPFQGSKSQDSSHHRDRTQ